MPPLAHRTHDSARAAAAGLCSAMTGSASGAQPRAGRTLVGRAFAGLGLGLALTALPGLAAAQAAPAPPAAAAPTTASVPEALKFINEQLARNASTWRPCKGTATLELAQDGVVTVVVKRQSYCEDSRFRASVRELDAAAVSFEVLDEIVLRVPCQQEAACARHWQKKKKRSGNSWVARTDQWDPSGPGAQPHQVTALELPLGSDPQVAQRITTALQYLVRTAQGAPEYAAPADPFAAGAGGT
jgi:hypothetical protein